ncbi:thioredoxin family protein [Bradyrhizobium sediminis]|uniref:Thioredoxin family protein n=1 Tax=Bradyrhizobium sediminis TaxID=2840469 RepID=A0A975NG73_9BRAD|nr:thioredoxin family protein [Bradyrhizobium sediminis]QWG14245.1 thioredoxin family protein [Bradyrhizobium sediminis]
MLSRRSILVASLVASFLVMAPALAETAPAFDAKVFDAKIFADAQKAGKPILIAIHASWCPTCKAQAPILSELRADPRFKDLAYFVVDFDSQKDVVKRLGANMQSTLIAFKGEKEEGRSVGDTRRASIYALVEKSI